MLRVSAVSKGFSLFAAIGLLLVSCATSSAVVLQDFQDGSYEGFGTEMIDPKDPNNIVLKLVSNGDDGNGGTIAEIFSIDAPSSAGTFRFDIYDFGATAEDFPTIGSAVHDFGPKWGVQGDANTGDAAPLDNWAAAGIVSRSFTPVNGGYTFLFDPNSLDGSVATSFNGDWFSVESFGNPRRVKTDPIGAQPSILGAIPPRGIQEIGAGTADNPDIDGTGAWTTWEIVVNASGDVAISALGPDVDPENPTKYDDAPYATDTRTSLPFAGTDLTLVNLKELWVSGGNDSCPACLLGRTGVLLDNVEFIPLAGAVVNGDYNGNGVVDASDYTVWLDSLGASLTLPGENPGAATPGTVDQEDYDFWKSRFGAVSGTATGSAIPEPHSLVLLFIGACLPCIAKRRPNRCSTES